MVMKHYSPTGRRNYGRPLKRLLDTWDRNASTSGPTPWEIYGDDNGDDDDDKINVKWLQVHFVGLMLVTVKGTENVENKIKINPRD